VIIVDTSVWIDYFAGTANEQTDWLDRELTHRPIGLVDLILCEILQGVRTETQFQKVRSDLIDVEFFETGGEELAISSARNYRTLRSKGHAIRKTIHCLIATFCLREGHALLHRDQDFTPFETHLGLHVIHPAGLGRPQ
jgi:predicted nucleic acid-binding protein